MYFFTEVASAFCWVAVGVIAFECPYPCFSFTPVEVIHGVGGGHQIWDVF